MPGEILFDEDDLQQVSPLWNASDWIGCGRTYRDVPEHVALEAMRACQVSRNTAILLQTLTDELPGLIRMATKLNTVWRKGKGNVNILDIEEDDCGVDD